MLSAIMSYGFIGIEGFPVRVETNLSTGLPSFDIVGLPDAAVKESRERVRAAVKNRGFAFPSDRITVNLAPADVKKEGPGFDLPIALGILASSGFLGPRPGRYTPSASFRWTGPCTACAARCPW